MAPSHTSGLQLNARAQRSSGGPSTAAATRHPNPTAHAVGKYTADQALACRVANATHRIARAARRSIRRLRDPRGRLSLPREAAMMATAMPTANVSRLAMGPNQVVNEPVVGRCSMENDHAFHARETAASAAVLAASTEMRCFLLARRRQTRARPRLRTIRVR